VSDKADWVYTCVSMYIYIKHTLFKQKVHTHQSISRQTLPCPTVLSETRIIYLLMLHANHLPNSFIQLLIMSTLKNKRQSSRNREIQTREIF